jgi:hypothetical protein
MTAIDITPIAADVPKLQKNWPTFKAVNDCDRDKIELDMEVSIRVKGETIRVKIEAMNDSLLIGKVLTKKFYFVQPFIEGDMIQFEKKNVIDIFDINRTGVLY